MDAHADRRPGRRPRCRAFPTSARRSPIPRKGRGAARRRRGPRHPAAEQRRPLRRGRRYGRHADAGGGALHPARGGGCPRDAAARRRAGPAGRGVPLVAWTQSTGVVAQATAALRDRLHLTGGAAHRAQRGAGGEPLRRAPRAGRRVADGSGRRVAQGARRRTAAAPAPRAPPCATTRVAARASSYGGVELAPERQSGVEGGFDLAFGGGFSLQVTAYDQLASGLIQRVALAVDTVGRPAAARRTRCRTWRRSPTAGGRCRAPRAWAGSSLEGAAAGVDSRVRRLAAGYGGDLRDGRPHAGGAGAHPERHRRVDRAPRVDGVADRRTARSTGSTTTGWRWRATFRRAPSRPRDGGRPAARATGAATTASRA